MRANILAGSGSIIAIVKIANTYRRIVRCLKRFRTIFINQSLIIVLINQFANDFLTLINDFKKASAFV